MLPLLGAVLPALIGGAVSAFGQQSANQANQAASREQMAFQERMANSAYQRSMSDMEKAGLNPILAYQQGGAATPGGSTYQAGNVGAAAVHGAAEAGGSALAMQRQEYDVDLLKQSAKLQGEQVDTQKAIQVRERAQAALAGAQSVQAVESALNTAAHTHILNESIATARAAAAMARSDEEFYNSEEGKKLRMLNRLFTNLNPFVDTGAQINRGIGQWAN